MPDIVTIKDPGTLENQREAVKYITDYLVATYGKHFTGFDYYYDQDTIKVLRINWEED